MADLGGFDANAKENQKVSNALPAGEYKAVMVASEKKPTKDVDGSYLSTQWQICEGEFQNRRFFHIFNLWLNPSKSQAIQIAKGQLSELCRAVGVSTPKDSAELHGKPVLVKLKVTENEYGQQNNVVKFSPVPTRSAITPPATPAEPAAQGSSPW
jgi:hypothetical protein